PTHARCSRGARARKELPWIPSASESDRLWLRGRSLRGTELRSLRSTYRDTACVLPVPPCRRISLAPGSLQTRRAVACAPRTQPACSPWRPLAVALLRRRGEGLCPPSPHPRWPPVEGWRNSGREP